MSLQPSLHWLLKWSQSYDYLFIYRVHKFSISFKNEENNFPNAHIVHMNSL